MNKTELLNKFSKDGEQRMELARVLDQMQCADTRSIPCPTQFLSPALRASVESLLCACGHPRHLFAGGYEGAERTICVFLPHWQEVEDYDQSQDLAAISAAFPRQATLTHRDILGALMGLGITREKIGDILMGEHEAQIVCLRETLPIVLSQFDQAGRYPLTLQEITLTQLTPAPQTVKEIHDTVATLRLDAVVASGFSLSRSKAAQCITTGRVSVNHMECVKSDRLVEQGDVLTCRGLGKCVLAQVGGQSRKGRIILTLHRYV